MSEMPDADTHADSWDEREALITRFEAAWQGGGRPDIDEFLPADATQRWKLLVELVHTDLEYRLRAGEAARVEEYLGRYPELRDDVDSALGLIEAEFRLRREREPGLSTEDYVSRFPDLKSRLNSLLGDDHTGQVLGGRYRPLSFHKAGGLGEVHLAEDTELPRRVALKRIQAQHRHDRASRERFVREAAITGQLDHPGVVPVYGLVEDEAGAPCYAMRFIEGESLQEAIARFHTAPHGRDAAALRQLLGHFVSACYSIAYAHSRGIVHRDLKPANIMVGCYSETLVVDWGMAKAQSGGSSDGGDGEPSSAVRDADLTQVGVAMGTPAFMSPEQAAGRWAEVGPASDIYGLGATLYALLAGRPPHTGVTPRDTIDLAQRGQCPPLRQIRPDAPAALEAVCARAMSPRPGDRYPSARALAEDVERWLADGPVSAYPEGSVQRLGRWVRRHSTWVQAGAAALGLVAMASLAAAILVEDARGKAETARENEAAERARAIDREKAERLRRYSAQAQAAGRAWRQGNVAAADHLLREMVPQVGEDDHRGFEWYFLQRQLRGGWLRTFEPVPGGVMAFSPEDNRLALAGPDGDILVRDARTGEACSGSVPSRREPVVFVSFAAGGRSLVAVRRDGHVQVCDAGKPPRSFPTLDTEVLAVALAPDGTALALLQRNQSKKEESPTVQIWGLAEGRSKSDLPLPADGHLTLAFSPDSKTLVVGQEHRVQAWDWSPPQGHLLDAFDLNGDTVSGTTYAPDGKTVAVGTTSGAVWLWRVGSGQSAHALPGHTNIVRTLAFSPDGERLATGCDDSLVRVCNLATGQNTILSRDQGIVRQVAFSADSELLAVADGRQVTVWDSDRNPECDRLPGPIGHVAALTFSPDGKSLFTAAGVTAQGELCRWNVADLTLQARFQGPPPVVTAIAFSQDRKRLAVALGQVESQARHVCVAIEVWDLNGGLKWAHKGHEQPVHGLAFSPDGNTLLSTSTDLNPVAGQLRSGELKVWDAATGEEKGVFRSRGELTNLAIPADGSVVAVQGGHGVVHLRDVRTAKSLGTLTCPQKVSFKVAVSPDGRWLAVGHAHPTGDLSQSGSVTLWDLPARKVLHVLKCHPGAVLALAFSPDSRLLASGCAGGQMSVWEAETGIGLGKDEYSGGVIDLKFSASSKEVVSVVFEQSRAHLRRWDVTEKKALTGVRVPLEGVVVGFDDRGEELACEFGQGGVQLVVVKTGKPKAISRKPEDVDRSWHPEGVTALAVAPGGDTLATGGIDGAVKLWNVQSRKVVATLVGHDATVRHLAFSTDGKTLVSGSRAAAGPGEVRLWDVGKRTERRALDRRPGGVVGLALTPDGRSLVWAAGAADSRPGEVVVSDVETGATTRQWTSASFVRGTCMALSADGQTLATAGVIGDQPRRPFGVLLWDLPSGRERARLVGHARLGTVEAMAFSPDGRTLATSGQDKSVRLWSVATGEELLVLPGLADPGSAVAFAPDGTSLVVGGTHNNAGVVQLWRASR